MEDGPDALQLCIWVCMMIKKTQRQNKPNGFYYNLATQKWFLWLISDRAGPVNGVDI